MGGCAGTAKHRGTAEIRGRANNKRASFTEDADRKVGPSIPCVNFSRCGGLRGQAMTLAGAERRKTRLWLPIAYSIGLIARRAGSGGR
jgi:hypothetical protein